MCATPVETSGAKITGGVGGSSGRAPLWLALVIPYPLGWVMAVWGPGSPRWFSWLTIAVGLWWVAIPPMLTLRGAPASRSGLTAPLVLGVLGIATMAGGVARLRHAAA